MCKLFCTDEYSVKKCVCMSRNRSNMCKVFIYVCRLGVICMYVLFVCDVYGYRYVYVKCDVYEGMYALYMYICETVGRRSIYMFGM